MRTTILLLALAMLTCTATDAADTNWTSVGGTADEASYSPLDKINTRNVRRLGLAWSLDLENEQSLEATPLAVDGVLYFTGARAAAYAVDAVRGRLLWKHDPETWKHAPEKMYSGLPVNRGVAYADGRVFVCAMDGLLQALDAKTGQVLWSVATVEQGAPHYSTGAPRTFKDMVIIGNGGADSGARGYVTAYEAKSGRQRWRFYTVPGTPEENRGDEAMERAAATWSGEYWKTGSGGTVWNGITFDAELDRIYIGTGNGGPYDVARRSPGGGDNLYLASIVALDANTGKYVWHYQVNPREAWDYKATANMIAATLTIDGKPRKVLMQAPTNGFFYVLDRDTGKLISAEKIAKATWAERIDLATGRPVEYPNIRYENGEQVFWPGTLGAHNWQPMSFSPRTRLVYIPTMHLGARIQRSEPQPGKLSFGGLVLTPVKQDVDDGTGALLAWDPIAQAPRWRVRHETLWNGGTLVTAGGLVLQGTADGFFSAYDASSGERLWRFDAGLGIIAAPSTYTVNGKQYISILVGYGGSSGIMSSVLDVGWKYGAQPRRLLTFTLDGKARLAPTPPRDFVVHAVDDPALQIDARDVAAGRMLYAACSGCHGIDLRSAGSPGPDLRESGLALTEAGLWSVVHDGTLASRGMPPFPMFTREQVRQIHAYIRASARDVLREQRQ